MNQNLEEQRIRRLFHEARKHDLNGAPAFGETLSEAQSHSARSRRPLSPWRLCGAVGIALTVCGAALWVYYAAIRKETPSSDPQAKTQTLELLPLPVVPPASPGPPSMTIDPPPSTLLPFFRPEVATGGIPGTWTRPRSIRHHRAPVRSERSAERASLMSLSWRSPTDFLLDTPGNDLFKTLPRLHDSLIRFDGVHSEDKN